MSLLLPNTYQLFREGTCSSCSKPGHGRTPQGVLSSLTPTERPPILRISPELRGRGNADFSSQRCVLHSKLFTLSSQCSFLQSLVQRKFQTLGEPVTFICQFFQKYWCQGLEKVAVIHSIYLTTISLFSQKILKLGCFPVEMLGNVLVYLVNLTTRHTDGTYTVMKRPLPSKKTGTPVPTTLGG